MPRLPAYLMLLIMLLQGAAGAAWATPVPAPAERREIRSGKMDEYRKQRAFRYEQPAPRGRGIWDRIWIWLWRQAENLFSGRRATRVFDLLKWLLPAFILGFAVVRIAGMERATPWSRRRGRHADENTDPAANIHAIDFEAEIAGAETDARYRDAVRLQYLLTLKWLTDRGRIDWKSDKTNADYVAELNGKPGSVEFAALTHIYECAWYGELPVNGDAYTKIRPGFHGFRDRIGS